MMQLNRGPTSYNLFFLKRVEWEEIVFLLFPSYIYTATELVTVFYTQGNKLQRYGLWVNILFCLNVYVGIL